MSAIELEKCFALIKSKFPKIKKNQIVLRDYGWDYLAFIVNNSIVFRFPRDERALRSLGCQIKFATLFAQRASLTIPQPRLENAEGLQFMTYPFIHGEPLKPLWLKRYSTNNQNKIARQLGRFLTEVHAFPIQTAFKIGIRKKQAGLVSNDSVAHFRIHLRSHISTFEWTWVVKRLTEIQSLIHRSKFIPVVAHNDIAPQHILFNPNKSKLTGIIDFGDLGVGDPAVDFFRLRVYPRSFVDKVKNSYKGVIDELFMEREKGYEDLTIMHRLAHYIKKGDRGLSKAILNSLRRRAKRDK